MEEFKLEPGFEEEKSEVRKVIEEAFFKQQELFDKTYKNFNPMIFLTNQRIKINSNKRYEWKIPNHG